MSFCVADAVTGRNLVEGQPVVGFIVSHRNGHYPLDKNPNENGIYPSHYFALESLPIFGTCEDCGALDVEDESQLAVRLALRMTGTSSWEQLAEQAFNHHHGVQFFGRADEATESGARKSYRRVYGLCLMHLDTYNHLVRHGRSCLADHYACDGFRGEHRMPSDKEPDIAAVKALLNHCIQSPANIWRKLEGAEPSAETFVANKPSVEEFVAASNLSRICSLNAGDFELQAVIAGYSLVPHLIQALDTSNGVLFGQDFQALLRGSGLIGHALLKRPEPSVDNIPDLDELLSLLWDCLHLKNRMYDVHAHFFPSFYAGQDRNHPSILELSRASWQDVWKELLNAYEDNPWKRGHEALSDELRRMEDLTAALKSQLAALRDES